MIAVNNTWQGIVGDNWPYSQGKEISKKSKARYHKTYQVIHTILKLPSCSKIDCWDAKGISHDHF